MIAAYYTTAIVATLITWLIASEAYTIKNETSRYGRWWRKYIIDGDENL